MLDIESRFIEQINQDPDDRATQLIYADWLDGIGDPRAEAWRVLIEAGITPYRTVRRTSRGRYCFGYHRLQSVMGWADYFQEIRGRRFPTFYSAMDAAAVAWVLCHRPEFLMEAEAGAR